jgi:hypothetical protein
MKMLGIDKLRSHWYVIVSIIAVAGLMVGVYAFTVTWSAPVSIIATTPDIRVYWDAACTNPATSLSFGNVQQGAYMEFHLYIKNQGTGEVKIYWNSTVSSATSNKIQDQWRQYPYYGIYNFNCPKTSSYGWWNGSSLSTSGVWNTYYMIRVDGSTPLSSYSWTLYLGSWTD